MEKWGRGGSDPRGNDDSKLGEAERGSTASNWAGSRYRVFLQTPDRLVRSCSWSFGF